MKRIIPYISILIVLIEFFSISTSTHAISPITAIGPISGTTQVGQTLTAGAITPASAAATATYQWQNSYSPNGITINGVSGVFLNIPGATSRTFTLSIIENNTYVRVEVRGSNGETIQSAVTTIITNGTSSSNPITSFGPIIGTAQVGQTLTAGAVTPIGTTVAYRWQIGNSSNGTFSDISGATSRTHVLISTEVGKYLRVIARDSTGGERSATTTTAVVVANIPPGGPIGTCVVDAPIPGLGSGPFTNTQNDCVSPPINGRWTINTITPPPAPTETTYTPLAPLPGFPTVDCTRGTPQCVCDDNGVCKKTIFNTADDSAFGTYLNIMVRLIIGLIAVGAVVMIFMGGIEYMTSEIISNKEHGKERIRNAILGLLLALGAYTLLNTINPDLLKSNLDIDEVEITIEAEQEDVTTLENSFAGIGALPSGGIGVCPEGIVRINDVSGGVFMNVCRRIYDNFRNLITAASSAGINLTGFGFRSQANQIALRSRHCGPPTPTSNPNDLYRKPANQCTPATARPGRSNHESGLAIDFKCNGQFVNPTAHPSTTPCFTWLQANAGSFGFQNLNGEPWHWSIDGQ